MIIFDIFSLEEAKFPVRILPRIAAAGSVAGRTSNKKWRTLPEGIPVLVALGDFQCSFLARQALETDAGSVAATFEM